MRSPSAIVTGGRWGARRPVRFDSSASPASAGSAPTIRRSGRAARAAIAMPEIMPPPPTGTTSVAASGTCPRTSSAMVPCPAITHGWSNGGTIVAPVRACTSVAAASRSAPELPLVMTFAPARSTALRFVREAFAGITTCAGMPRSAAAVASASAWFPELCVTTPRGASASAMLRTAFVAPRILKLPVRCIDSHLKTTSRPASAEVACAGSAGVRRTCGAILAAASATSFAVTACGRAEGLIPRWSRCARAPRGSSSSRAARGPCCGT